MTHPPSPAIQALQAKGIVFKEHRFPYLEKGGTKHSSQSLGVNEHAVIKTLVFETDQKTHSVMLMHGDRSVDTKKLAQAMGCRRAFSCAPEKATELSGYLIGGTSPFGFKTPLPVFAQESIRTLDRIWINGGERGFLVEITPKDLECVISLNWIEAVKL